MNKLLLAAVLWSLVGCYTHVPVESQPEPDVGKEVRVYLAQSQDLSAGNITIQGVTRVDGVLYERTPDSLAVWAKWLRTRRGDRYYANGQVHFVDRQEVEEYEVRQLHVARTALATFLAASAATGVFAFTADLGGASGGDPDPGDTQSRLSAPVPLTAMPRIP